ncbi:flavodoxin family protein [Thermus thermamylovorans]|uniref:Flavodoxin family protein n=1 Tax=Thermus thermamylovorans TaxID=2509362 RepID=A0A4Q9B5N1_9DEIN|nr:flavodoxin family protein [Thermus thermamylovorans]TBH20691.1 flavodoxin family protein [Thermus thermamylovorans]
MGLRVLGVNASVRTDGFTAELLDKVLEAARRKGALTERLDLVRHPFPFCAGNYSVDPASCGPETCVQGPWDGFGRVAERILNADAVVFATPVYWFSVSARMKALLERMTSMENRGLLNLGKPMALLAVAEEEGASQALAQMLLPLTYMGFVLAPLGLVYAHRRDLVSLEEDPELAEDAQVAGENLVLMAQTLQGLPFREPLPAQPLQGVAAD